MLNKILIEHILKQLLEDAFAMTFIKHAYSIKKQKTHFEIIIYALLYDGRTMINKSRKMHIKNWTKMIINYEKIKEDIRIDLIDNIREG